MKPPNEIKVIHNDPVPGFTIETVGRVNGVNTLWRPVQVLLGRPKIGYLRSYKENSFYQNNDNVTEARYKIRGYRYPIICWFDNETGERIA